MVGPVPNFEGARWRRVVVLDPDGRPCEPVEGWVVAHRARIEVWSNPEPGRENIGQRRHGRRHSQLSSVEISIALSMLLATGHRLAWNECERSAASRLSSGQPVRVQRTRILLITSTLSSR